MRRLLSLLVLALAIAGIGSARKIHIIADIAGDGSAHQFLTTITRVSFWQVQAMPGNSATTCGSSSVAGCPRIGDSTVSTGTGVWLIPGSSQSFPSHGGQ